MRWLVGHPGPSFSVADMFEGWVEALRGLGEQVWTYQLDDRLVFFDGAHVQVSGVEDDEGKPAFRKSVSREQAVVMASEGILAEAFKSWPHVILLVSAFFIRPLYLDIFRDRGMKVVLLHSESPYQDDEQLTRASHADLNLLNDPVNIQRYQDLGVPAGYMPHAYRPHVHYPAPAGAAKQWDLSFIGTGFASRVKFFEQMNLDGLSVNLRGPWLDLPPGSPLRDCTRVGQRGDHDTFEDCVSNDETAGIYRDSRCGINFYRRESEDAHAGEGWAVGPREVELAACGTWFTRDPRPESDALFPMLPAYTSPGEAAEQIRWALAHPAAREKAAAQARAAIADRTFEANARQLLKLLDT